MSIKYDITSEIDSLIGGMLIVNGFNSDYSNVNEHRPGSKTYPNVITEYSEEEFLDPDDQVVDTYSGKLTAKFKIMVDDVVSPPRLALASVLEDFEKLLEDEHDILQGKGWIKGDLISDESFFSKVRKRPGTIEQEWEIEYRVKRSNPKVTS